MNVYTNISFLFGMLIVSSTAYAQRASKTYFHTAPLNIDTIFVPVSKGFGSNSNHIWLNTLSSQYVDTVKNKINPSAIPVYREIKNTSFLGPHNVNKQMTAGLYYRPIFSQTSSNGKGWTTDSPMFQPYSPMPYGSYTIKATASPYFILPKF